jgi:23S rRNA-/tRNA-specific pseudouridylate synthase
LDNDTSGLLYFAKNPRVYQQFKQMQSIFLVNKYYLAEVYGDISSFIQNSSNMSSQEYPKDCFIDFPIAHHRYNNDRMVVVKQPSDMKKTK